MKRRDCLNPPLAMLRRIAAALNKRVEIRFVSVKPATKPA
jgi:hypothetical protein